MQDLKPIRVFLEVAQQSSFVGAAKALKMTPASVTRIVARLEETLGQQLLVRTTRRVSLTNAGAMVAARYGPLIEAFDQTTEELVQANRPHVGRLRLNAPLSMGMRMLPQMIEGFRLAYPNIAVDLRLTDRLVDIMDTGCDLAIRVSGPPSDKSTIWRKLCEVPLRAVASPALFERVPEPRTPDEIDPATTLSYSAEGMAETWVFRKGSITRQIKAGAHLVSNNGDFLFGLARSGGGIAVLPDFLVAAGLRRGEVVEVLPDWQLPTLWLTLFYPPYDRLPPVVAAFSEFFEAYIRDFDGLIFDG